jgi:glycosyltransferase involved in cell wall biosynthesis
MSGSGRPTPTGRNRNAGRHRHNVGDRSTRVLIAHPSADLYGSDLVMLESVTALVDSGAAVTVTVPAPGPLVDRLEERGAQVLVSPAPVLRRSVLTPLGAIRFAAECLAGSVTGLRLLRQVRPDLLYVNTVTIPLWLVLGRLTGVPVVAHIHEAERAAPLLVRKVLAAPLLLARRVISNSDHCVSVVSGAFPSLARRSVVIRNPVAGPRSPQPTRARLDGGLRVLYLGRVSGRKGVDVAVRAVAAMRRDGVQAELDIVGDVFPGYEWYLRDLHNLVAELGIADAVRFHGYQADVWPHLAASDVVVVPSRLEEGFGNTAVEGILAGRPVIVSDTSGLREASDRFEAAQRVPPGDPDALAARLTEVSERWADLRMAAAIDQCQAYERYDPAHFRARIVETVQAVVGEPSAVPAERPDELPRPERVTPASGVPTA